MILKRWTKQDDEKLEAIIRIIQQWENDNMENENCFYNHHPYTSWLELKGKILKLPWYKRFFYFVIGK